MSTHEAIGLLLKCINTRRQYIGGLGGFGGDGTTGNIQMMQRDTNAAIALWREKHDTSGLVQVTTTLHAYGNLTDTDYEQIMVAIDGEK